MYVSRQMHCKCYSWQLIYDLFVSALVVLATGGDGAAAAAGGARRGGNIPNRAVGRIVPGAIFLNSNMLPNRTCWITGNLASSCKEKTQ